MQQILIGRQGECEQLRSCMSSNRSEFVIVCGRRRIGKTFLIDSFFNGGYDFTYVGSHKAKTPIQLRRFAKALAEHSGQEQRDFADWYDAFDALQAYLGSLPGDRKKVVFIDEMPWIDKIRSTFVSALEDFWNGWANRREDIVFIASGSATSWMADNLIDNQGGLHNRITRRIFLEPFTLKETEEYIHNFAPHWERYDILQCYMLTGGVPYYLSVMDFNLSVAQNVDRLCFAENGVLRNEFSELYNSLFTHTDSYLKVIDALYSHKSGLTRKEVSEQTKLNGQFLNTMLRNLEQCDIISKRELYGHRNVMVYRLIDFYTLFYLKFIAGKHKLDPQWWSHHLDDAGVRAWRGLTFELICMQHHQQIKKALGISGIATEVSTWKSEPTETIPGAQVDMLIERADRVIHLCEMKFSDGKYNITNEYETKLRNRRDVFRVVTRTKKSIVHTFVTTYGLGEGKHHSIVHSEVTMDDLFEA